jgi:hypothetical protein
MGEIAASTLDEYFSNYVDTEYALPSLSMEKDEKEKEKDTSENVPVATESDDEFVEL